MRRELVVLSRSLSDGPAFEHLGVEECWRLLASRAHGRICFCVEDRVHLVLTAYVVRSPHVYFRTTAFGAVSRRVQTRPVTLQADNLSGEDRALWSVTATGTAHHVDDAATLASLWTPVRPVPWGAGHQPLWIALVPDDVQGERLRG